MTTGITQSRIGESGLLTSSDIRRMLNGYLLSTENNRSLRELNDIYISCELAVGGLQLHLRKIEDAERQGRVRVHISAPTAKGKVGHISRGAKVLKSLVNEAIDTRLYVQALVTAVSLVEDRVGKMLVRQMRAHPRKLLIGPKGMEATIGDPQPVDLRDVVAAADLDDLVREAASKRVNDALRGSPRQYFDYLQAVLECGLPDEVVESFAEVKATRDVFVHNAGFVDNAYLRKADKRARQDAGSPLPMNLEYLDHSIRTMKSILTCVTDGLRKKHGNCERLNRLLTRR